MSIKIHKIFVFYPNNIFVLTEVHCMNYRIRWENKTVDVMGTVLKPFIYMYGRANTTELCF